MMRHRYLEGPSSPSSPKLDLYSLTNDVGTIASHSCMQDTGDHDEFRRPSARASICNVEAYDVSPQEPDRSGG